MSQQIRKSRLLFLLILTLFIAACGTNSDRWAGLAQTEQGEIFVAYDKFVAKIDASNGDTIWEYPDEDDREHLFFATPIYDEDTVYIGDYTGNVHAIDRESGDRRWLHAAKTGTKLLGIANFGGSTDRVIAPLALAGDVLLVPNEEGIYRLDRETGERVDDWTFETDRAIWSQPMYIPAGDDQPARLYITGLDHHLYSLDSEAGEILWEVDLGGAAPSRPAFDVERNLLFVGTFGSEVIAVDAENGDIVARYETESWVWEAPVIFDGLLYFADLAGNVKALEFADGEFTEIWSEQPGEGKIRAQPLVTEELVVVATSEGSIIALERANGNSEWEEQLDERKLFSALIPIEVVTADGETTTLVITSTSEADELVVGLRLDNGNHEWSYKHES